MKKIVLFIMILSVGFLQSCNDKKPVETNGEQLKSRVNLVPTYNGSEMQFNQNYSTQEGYTISFTKLNVIMTKFQNNGKQLFESAVYKFEKDKKLFWEGVGDYSSFSSFSATIGVDSLQNHEDPSARPSDDPLFILNTGDMHWGWNTGYIFVMIEGRIDTTAAQTGDHLTSFAYHLGNDQLTRDFTLNNIQWKKVNNYLYETDIYLDLYKVFDGAANDIDIKNERTSHTNPDQVELSKKVIDNFIEALSK